MSDKILRDELLRSHRYRTLSSDTTRLLFIHLLLCADALGNCEATTTAIGDAMGRPVDESTAAKWLSELSDVDIIRTYDDGGKRYVHIPRFRQRLRYPKGKHPRPPSNLECSEIRELAEKVRPQSDSSQTTVRPQSDEVKRSEVKRSEEKLLSSKLDDARLVLEYLNVKAGKKFLPTGANLKMVSARIAESSVDLCKQVIDAKVVEWGRDEKMRKYIRPMTIFAASNFGSYAGNDSPDFKQEPRLAI